MPLTTFTVKKDVLHDGKHHRPGKPLQLSDEQAAPLVESGHIEVAEEQATQPETISAATLGKLTKESLITLALQHTVNIPADATKAVIVELLVASGKLA